MSWFRSLLLSALADGEVLVRRGKGFDGAEISTLTPAGNWLPDATGTRDLGVTGTRWRDLFLSRNATVGGTLAVTGDLTAGGGLRSLLQFGQQNVAAGDNATPAAATPVAAQWCGVAAIAVPWLAPRAGSVTGLSVALSGNAAGSSLIAGVYVNDVLVHSTAVVTIASGQRGAYVTLAKDLAPFAAGDAVDVRIRTGSGWSATTLDAAITLEIET